jgi:hypothetical protein
MSVTRSVPCRSHNVHGCVCLWTKEQLGKAGIAMDSVPRMTLPAVAMDSAPFAKDALTDDEKSLIEMAIRSVQRPARRAQVAQDQKAVDPNAEYAKLFRSDSVQPFVYTRE